MKLTVEVLVWEQHNKHFGFKAIIILHTDIVLERYKGTRAPSLRNCYRAQL